MAAASAPRARGTRPAVYRHFHRIAWLAVLLTFAVIVFGAFVRLSDAGLSCPDWPTCYGRATWPAAVHEAADHAASAIRAFDTGKAWREQIHRHLAAVLGVLVLVLALLAARGRRWGSAQVLGAALLVALATVLYMRALAWEALVVAAIGEAVLLWAALRWNNRDFARTAVLTLAVVIFQALLGQWTVTLLLKPVVVMGHLLGGLLTFSLLLWMAWRATDRPIRLITARMLQRWLLIGIALLALQIALGGWVSANYAALSCSAGGWTTTPAHWLDFPRCIGQWWPPMDAAEGFVLWRGIGVDYEGGVLDGPARIAIQMAHRGMALVVFIALLAIAARLARTPGLRSWAAALALLTLTQVLLGILNVKLALPLWTAVLHNADAALLLAVLVSLLARLRAPDAG